MLKYNYKNYTSDDYSAFLEDIQEVGYVEACNHPIVYVRGLPTAKPKEIVLFENGTVGQVMSLDEELVEVVSLSHRTPSISEKVCRTNNSLEMGVGGYLLGKVVDPLGKSMYQEVDRFTPEEYRNTDPKPAGIEKRVKINQYLETGVSVVDMLVPLGKGQRELVIGDRKTGKTDFILQVILNQAKKGVVCIYAGIGKNALDFKKVESFMDSYEIRKNCVIVGTYSSDPPAIVSLTPYSAMTVAEYFMERGEDVLLVLDDLTDHAKYYRELSLIAKKFPGRASYPADIFYTHSRLLERAGYFKTQKGINAITCLPVAETVEGDITGYIQTNLMSITDGHIFFDKELFLQGRRPSVNYFLSVTRVGRQTQTKLKWSVGRELSNFLTLLEKTQSFVHFGAEINEGIKATLAMGDKIIGNFFNQPSGHVLDTNLQILLFSLTWSQAFKEQDSEQLADQHQKIVTKYTTDASYKKLVDEIIASCDDFNKLLGVISARQSDFI